MPSKCCDETRPDAVYIMLPPFAHGPAEDLVIEHRLPFFVEKPVAIDLPTALRTMEGVQQHGLITSVGYMNRYREAVLRVREILQGQKPVLLHGGWLGGGPQEYVGIWRWWVQRDKSGGQFLEQTTHTIDLARFLFGDVTEVYAVPVRERRERPDFFTIEDASMVQVALRQWRGRQPLQFGQHVARRRRVPERLGHRYARRVHRLGAQRAHLPAGARTGEHCR